MERNIGAPAGRHLRIPSPTLIASLIFVVVVSLYLVYPTAHYSFDAVAGGVLMNQWIALGKGAQLFHKYHILYLPLVAAVERVLRGVGVLVDPLNLMWLVNAFSAAGAVAAYYLLAVSFHLSRRVSLILTVLLSLGYSLWYYATDGEAYAVSLFFLVLGFHAARSAAVSGRLARACLAGACLALAMDFHITCLLALPAIALAAWPQTAASSAHGARQVLALLVTALVLAAVPYGAVYLAQEHTDVISGMAGDLSATLSPDYRDTLWWSLSPRNLLTEWHGLAESLAPVQSRDAVSSFPGLAHAVQWGLLALTLLPLLLVLPAPQGPGKPRAPWIVPLAWFLPTFVFFSTWAVGSDKYAAFQWAPLLILAALALERTATNRVVHRTSLAAIALLAVATAVCGFDMIRRQTDGGTNPHLQRALAIESLTGPEDLVVHTGRGDYQYQKVYLPYFALRPSMILDFHFDKTQWDSATAFRRIAARIDAHLAAGKRVLVMPDVAEPTPQRDDFEALHGLEPGALAQFLAAYHPTVAAQNALLGRVWELHAPS